MISHAKTHKPLTDLIEYHFVELSKFKEDKPAKLRSKFEKWLHLIKFGDLYRSVEDLPDDLKNEKGINEVVNKMAVANTNEHFREIMISREMFLLDINTDKQAARKEGLEKGLEKGSVAHKTSLNTILRSRFAQVSDATIAALEAINDLDVLQNLVVKAALSDSIDAFEDCLKTAQKSTAKKTPDKIVSEPATEYKAPKKAKATRRKP